ncbi:MAG: glycosyltransferase family 4 protein, partial [Aquificaceae bacterium]|nr:glycosyltransferase family 4 protein [Aquificaceae bacterium]
LSVVDGIGWGGTKEQVYLLARELSKRGIDIHVALSYQYDLMVEKLSPYNVKLHFFENHNKYARFNPLNYYRLWKIINQFDFDVVIANSPHTLDFVRVVFAFLRKPKRPKLIVVKRTYRKSNRLSIELKYKYADVIVAVSEELRDLLIESGLDKEKIRVIRSGNDLERFRPLPEEFRIAKRKQLGIDEKQIVFINVANCIPHQKGQHILIQAFSRLNCENCVLLLLGHETEKCLKLVDEEILRNTKGKIIPLGFRHDVEEFINMSDYLVVSSLFEGIANSLVQGMACGKVCIATDCGGIANYLRDGYNGFLIKPGSVNELVSAMQKVMKLSKDEYKSISERAIETSKEMDINKTVDKYISLFKELCGVE